MKLTLVSEDSGLVRIDSAEDITLLDFVGGAQPLDALLGAEGYRSFVLLSLANSAYIDSSGVGWLVQCHSRFQKAGGRLVLHTIAPMVNHCFRMLGMYDVLNIAADEAAARKMASAPPLTPLSAQGPAARGEG
jgi:anti-anti-sigma factor